MEKSHKIAEHIIHTLHPNGKQGKNIEIRKYEIIKSALLSIIKENEVSHLELFGILNEKLKDNFQGNISWYGETVKLDLEARGIIERTNSKPQTYKLKQ